MFARTSRLHTDRNYLLPAMVVGAFLLLLFVPKLDLPAHAGEEKRPTLIIYGHGINTDGLTLRGYVEQMFHTKSEGFASVHVKFDNNGARTDEGGQIRAPLNDNSTIAGGAQQVAAMVKGSGDRVALNLDMNLYGVNVAATKGLLGPALMEATIPLTPFGVPQEVAKSLDKVRTSWNSQTERAARFIEEAARAFKVQHPDGEVIVVGHSAFTNAVNLVPTMDGTTRLIDMRVMSSTMVHDLKYKDPEHTVFLTHEVDLPSANNGNVWSPASSGNLANEGTVIHLKGYPSANYASQLQMTPPSYKKGDFLGHIYTYEYGQYFDMKVETKAGTQEFRGRPQDVIRTQLNEIHVSSSAPQSEIHAGSSASQNILNTLKQETPKESRVGGVSFTKPAQVPLAPSDLARLEFSNSSKRLRFVTRTGEEIAILPDQDLSSAVQAEAAACVYRDRPPEISLLYGGKDETGVWDVVDYKCKLMPFTSLLQAMAHADMELAQVAWGQDTSFKRPAGLDNYHPFAELTLDNAAFNQGKIGGRVWIVPADITTVREDNALHLGSLAMAVRFEFYPEDKAVEYYTQNADVGRSDPAGDFLASQLTAHYDDLAASFPALAEARKMAALVGVLIWAKQNNIPLDDPASWEAMAATGGNDNTGQRPIVEQGLDAIRIKKSDGKEYFAVSGGELRKVVESDLKRPAPIFNEFGLSRILWQDGSQSRIEYGNGRIVRLIGRKGDVLRVLYDPQSRPVAMVAANGNGVAALWSDKGPVLFEGVRINAAKAVYKLQRNSRIELENDISGAFGDRIKDWLAAQANNLRTSSLLDLPLERGSFNVFWLAPFFVISTVLVMVYLARRSSAMPRRSRAAPTDFFE